MGAKRAYELVDRKIVAVSPTTTVAAALKLEEISNVGTLLVIDGGRLVGIIEEGVLNDGKPKDAVRKLMANPVYVEKDATVEEVVAAIIKGDISRLPVVESEKTMRCIGVISATEVLKNMNIKRKK